MPNLSEPSKVVTDHSSVEKLPLLNKTKLIYHVNKLTDVHHLCIPPSVVPDIFFIAHEDGHLGFAHCYKIVTHSWYIRGLTKPLRSFIQYYAQCLALQTRRYPPYSPLQPIQFPLIPFLTLTFDFVFAFLVSIIGFNALISVTCKFSKRVTLIEGVNIWLAEQ